MPRPTGVFVQAEGADLAVPASGCLGVFPRVMDFDGDGRKDLLLGLADGRVQVRLNVNTDADPLFGPASYVQVGPPGSKSDVNFGSRATLEVVDWNNNDRLDLVLGAMDGKVRVLLDEATSPGDDKFVGRSTYGKLSGPGFKVQAQWFDALEACANNTGEDRAYLFDSPGDDWFIGDSTEAVMRGVGFHNTARWGRLRGLSATCGHRTHGGHRGRQQVATPG